LFPYKDKTPRLHLIKGTPPPPPTWLHFHLWTKRTTKQNRYPE